MKKFTVLVGAVALALALGGCTMNASLLEALGVTNAKVIAAAQRLDTTNTVLIADIPQLCKLASQAIPVGLAAVSVASGAVATQTAKAVNDVTAAANSAVCVTGLTGTIADAQTIANAINEIKAATGKSATTIANGS